MQTIKLHTISPLDNESVRFRSARVCRLAKNRYYSWSCKAAWLRVPGMFPGLIKSAAKKLMIIKRL